MGSKRVMHFIDQCSLTDYCVILDSHRLCLWRLGCSVVFVIAIWLDVEVELGASDLLVDGQNVLGTGLEVTGGVVTLGDVQVLSNCIIGWLVDVTDLDEHFLHFADEGEGWSNLLLWVISLNIRGDDHDVESLSANGVSMRDHSDVDVRISLKLLLRENNLDRGDTFSVGNLVVDDANSSDDLALDLGLSESGNICGVTDDERGTSILISASDSSHLTILEKNLINGSVEHVSTAMDGAETTE